MFLFPRTAPPGAPPYGAPYGALWGPPYGVPRASGCGEHARGTTAGLGHQRTRSSPQAQRLGSARRLARLWASASLRISAWISDFGWISKLIRLDFGFWLSFTRILLGVDLDLA